MPLHPGAYYLQEGIPMATATTSLVTVEQYLNTAYRPDVDYVEGVIEERNLGEFDHGNTIFALAKIFDAHRLEWNIRVALDTRMRIAHDLYRVPDLSITSIAAPKEQILHTPPVLCIEVLSPKDTLRKMRRRVAEYFAIGVANIWILDFHKRNATICHPDGNDLTQSDGVLTIPKTPIAVPLDNVFAILDEL
jgi:Uma2 family endonuclease